MSVPLRDTSFMTSSRTSSYTPTSSSPVMPILKMNEHQHAFNILAIFIFSSVSKYSAEDMQHIYCNM